MTATIPLDRVSSFYELLFSPVKNTETLVTKHDNGSEQMLTHAAKQLFRLTYDLHCM